MNIAGIGAGGQGKEDISSTSHNNNIVAICDVDFHRAAESFEAFPKAKQYKDFRRMFDEMGGQIDAVTVSMPDHQHAVAAMMAIKMSKHVYCQKPLAHDVYEARALTEAARKYDVVTQMGNQGTSEDGFREAVEIVRSGVIGAVREVHVWTDRPGWPQGVGRPKDTLPVPAHLDWDLWLGTAPERPYHSAYHPFAWRGWWDFGTGALGDMACHAANMPFMALELGYPISVEAETSDDLNNETYSTWSIIRYEFPARGNQPAVTLVWYDGGNNKPAHATEAIERHAQGCKLTGNGSLLVGDKGTLFSQDSQGAAYKLLPRKDFEGYTRPRATLPRAHGRHHREWINACKGIGKPMSNFDYAGPLTETVVLGCVAMRVVGTKILWDGKRIKVTNCPEANNYLRREYRKGWSL